MTNKEPLIINDPVKYEKFQQEKKKEERTVIEEKRKMLIRKKQNLFTSYYEVAAMKEPVIFLMRRNGKTDFYENQTKTDFEYEHSDGTVRKIYINSKYRTTFDMGKKQFSGYICHEDFPVPLPAEPEVTVETIGLAIDKTLNDYAAWKTKEILAKAKYWKTIGIVVALVFGLYILYKLVYVPTAIPATVETVKNVATVQVINATVFP